MDGARPQTRPEVCNYFLVAGESLVGVVMSVVLSRHQAVGESLLIEAVGESLLIDVPSSVVRPQIAFYPNGQFGPSCFLATHL